MSDDTDTPTPSDTRDGSNYSDTGSGGGSVGASAVEEHTTAEPVDPARPEGRWIERTSYGWEPHRPPSIRVVPPPRRALRPHRPPMRDRAPRCAAKRGEPRESRAGPDEPESEPRPGDARAPERLPKPSTFREHRRRHFHQPRSRTVATR
jgi:hypothetical protein